jgi:choline dehydrogenase
MEADYIVVGSGSAGAVIAARLSEDPRVQVLLLEAGFERDNPLIQAPVGVFRLITDATYNWCRIGEPDPSTNGRTAFFPGGKLLGGSSAINGLVYTRGLRADFDNWAAADATGWSYSEVLPYFLRSEGFQGPPSQQHGHFGPLGVSPGTVHPLAYTFIDACSAVGIQKLEDYCDGDLAGAFRTHGTIDRGRRSSTYHAFLKPAQNRPNLTIITEALVDRVVFEGRTAVGVSFKRRRAIYEARARREVILSAGTCASPVILERSGIGPARVLADAGVPVLVDLPGVGENMQDHPACGITRFVNVQTYNTYRNPVRAALAGLDWLLFHKGPLTSVSVQAMAYGRSRPDVDQPDYMLSFMPLCVDFGSGQPVLHKRQGIYIAANICRPKARGRVMLRSKNPEDAPIIQHRILESAEDVAVLTQALRDIDRIYEKGFSAILTDQQDFDPPQTDGEWLAWLRDNTALGYHTVGTCRMGGPNAVVDPTLRVIGVDRLRVADASVMPNLISGNTNATTIMIGERAADFLRHPA